ncbi:hypothetical protein K388_06565 [Streptomyces sp. KhCrAH-43]|nr:hypothetical protein [Streptomyces sp. SID4920]MYX68604.1 hypothetical protein [Streptomyces sp. SID8373]RAJ50854.1 hypothetical protein K388_06565 [Streptomyces sp. KhCrAH-43]
MGQSFSVRTMPDGDGEQHLAPLTERAYPARRVPQKATPSPSYEFPQAPRRSTSLNTSEAAYEQYIQSYPLRTRAIDRPH